MSSEKLEQVVTRLEKVADKLEASLAKGKCEEVGSAFLEPFNEIILGPVSQLAEVSIKIGGEVKDVGLMVQKGFLDTYEVLKVVASSKKPASDNVLQIIKPLSDRINEIKDYVGKNFKSQFKNHLDAVSAFVVSFGWIQTVSKPQAFISDTIESGMFYANRVLTGFKDKGEEHKVWVRTLKKCFEDLQNYTQEWHGSGVSWNQKGVEASVPSTSKSEASAPKQTTAPVKPAQSSIGVLFSEINKGTGITSGLKKVDDSQKTHKNPNLRAGAIVKETEKPGADYKSASARPVADKPPVMQLTGKKWMLEYQKNQEKLEIKEGDLSYSVYMHRCINTNVFIHQKINVVTLDNCINCKIQLVKGLISSVEVTNGKKIEIHADDVLPFVNVNNTEGCQVYLNDKSKEAKVSTSVSTTVNVCYWDSSNELVEYPIPHLFESFIKDGKLVTIIAECV